VQPVVALRQDFHDIAVIPDLLHAPIDFAPGPAKQPHPVAGGKRQCVFPPVLVNRVIDPLGLADLAASLQSFTR